MTREEDLLQIKHGALREMYKEAEPGLDFDDLRENPDEYPDDYYNHHELSGERVKEIFTKHVEESDLNLTSTEHAHLSISVITSMSPRSPMEDEQ